MNRFSHPSKAKQRSAFSLIEIVMALGIVSFALIGILGLFPLALESARESAAETRIGFIAQSILSDIESTELAQPVTATNPTAARTSLIFTGKSPDDLSSSSAYETLNLHTSDVLYLAFDAEGQCMDSTLSSNDFESGQSGAAFLARIRTTSSPSQHPGSVHIEVRIDYPAAANITNRNFQSFTTLL